MKVFKKVQILGSLALLTLTACDREGRMPVVAPQVDPNISITTVALKFVEENAVITADDMNPAKTSAAAGTAARIRYHFNSTYFTQIALVYAEQDSNGKEECGLYSDQITLKDREGQVVVPAIHARDYVRVEPNTEYDLEFSRDSRCEMPEFATRIVVTARLDQSTPNDFSPRATVARRCTIDQTTVMFVNVNVGSPISPGDTTREGAYAIADKSTVCGPALDIGGTGSRDMSSRMGLSGISVHSEMITDSARLNYDLTFDAASDYKTATLVCKSGDRKTRVLTGCEDVLIRFDLMGRVGE